MKKVLFIIILLCGSFAAMAQTKTAKKDTVSAKSKKDTTQKADTTSLQLGKISKAEAEKCLKAFQLNNAAIQSAGDKISFNDGNMCESLNEYFIQLILKKWPDLNQNKK